jgi:homoserine O-succinyltransferase
MPLAQSLHIGLINNMPDGALKATEHQFRSLLDAAARGIHVKLSLFALPDITRSDSSFHHIGRHYLNIDKLWDTELDGVIVTGAEPRTANLSDEPYWSTLTKILDWADRRANSTICSCLAAHAAVQHFDGIARRKLASKRFGVFECAKASDHELTTGIKSPFVMPHSRWNDLCEAELKKSGYSVLTRSADGAVDTFVKHRTSLFLFFQGHPEYEADSLLLEYRRDVGRFQRGERDTPPAPPEGYFDAQSGEPLANRWRPAAIEIYARWLAYQLARKYGPSTDSLRASRSLVTL